MAGERLISEEDVERKKTAVVILGAGALGFTVLGLFALLLSPRYPESTTRVELLVTGAIGMTVALFLGVALLAIWFDKEWFER